MVEHRPCNPVVVGSIPSAGSRNTNAPVSGGVFITRQKGQPLLPRYGLSRSGAIVAIFVALAAAASGEKSITYSAIRIA